MTIRTSRREVTACVRTSARHCRWGGRAWRGGGRCECVHVAICVSPKGGGGGHDVEAFGGDGGNGWGFVVGN